MDEELAEKLLDKINKRAEARRRGTLEPKARAFNKTVDEVINERLIKNRNAKKAHYINIQRFKENSDIITAFRKGARKSASLGFRANFGGVQGDVVGGRFSTDAVRKGEMKKAKDLLISRVKSIDNGPATFTAKGNDAELFKEVELPGSSKSPAIRKIGKAISDTYEDMRKLLNSVGANIGKTANYVSKQIHDASRLVSPTGSFYKDQKLKVKLIADKSDNRSLVEKIKEISENRWIDFITPLLDEKTFDGIDNRVKFLSDIFNNIIEGHYGRAFVTDTETGKEFRVPSPGNFTGKLEQERVLHFKKDGVSAYKYIKEYGAGSYFKSIERTLSKAGSDYGIISKLGTNPRAMFARLVRFLRDNYSDEAGKLGKGLEKHVDKAKLELEYMLGSFARPNQSLGGELLTGLNVLSSMRALALVTPRSFQDLAISASKLTEYGVSYTQTYVDMIKGLSGDTKKENLAIADLIHSNVHTMLGDIHSRSVAIDTPNNLLAKANQTFFKLNLLQKWDGFLRKGSGGILARALARSKSLSWENLPEGVRRNLNNYNISSDEWDLSRNNPINTPIIKNVITPDVSHIIPEDHIRTKLQKDFDLKSDESLKAKLEKDKAKGITSKRRRTKRVVNDDDISEFRRSLNLKWTTFYQNELDDLQIQPGVSTTASLLGGDKSNTVVGQLRKMFAMFKYFGVESTKRTLGRMIYGHGASSVWDGIIHMKGTRGQLLSFMVNSSVLSYIGISAATILQGRTPPDITKPSVVFDTMLDSGGFTALGSMFNGDFHSYGRSFLGGLFGPVGDELDSTAKLVSQAKDDLLTGTSLKNTLPTLERMGKGVTPIINAPFIKLPLDYLFLYHWMEVHNPGYLENMNNRLKKRTGQHYLFLPHQ